MHKRQPTTLCFHPASQKGFSELLALFAALSLSVNHVYTTETLGKESGKKQSTLCKGFTYKNLFSCSFGTNVKPNQENQCLRLIIQLLIGDHMVCGYLTAQMILTTLCVIWEVTDTRWNITMTKDFLRGLTVD